MVHKRKREINKERREAPFIHGSCNIHGSFSAFRHRSAVWKYSVAGVFPSDVVFHALFSAHYG